MNEYIILTSDGRIIGCESKAEVDLYFEEQRIEKIHEYCDNEGLDYEQLNSRKRREILLEINLNDDKDKVFKTKSIIKTINKAKIDEEEKSELIEILEDAFIEFNVEDYEDFGDILKSLEDDNS